jgi:hypothetical protein
VKNAEVALGILAKPGPAHVREHVQD